MATFGCIVVALSVGVLGEALAVSLLIHDTVALAFVIGNTLSPVNPSSMVMPARAVTLQGRRMSRALRMSVPTR
jgi:hypothetical protein